jgi:methylenetetrahydrofolate reductase (NADPH)
MKIIDKLNQKGIHISFEVFPPKTDAGFDKVLSATDEIAKLNPSYISVTYGAGGGTSKNTAKIASHIKDDLGVMSLAHLTCASSTKEEVGEVIENLKAHGIENILALRGDIPEGMEIDSIMLMNWYRKSRNMGISVLVQHVIRKDMWSRNIKRMISVI